MHTPVLTALSSQTPSDAITVCGWVRTRRDAKAFSFIEINDGRRCGAFSQYNAVETEVRRYVADLDEQSKRRIWESSDDANVIPNASIETITGCLYPHIFQATLPRIQRAVRNRVWKEGEQGVLPNA